MGRAGEEARVGGIAVGTRVSLVSKGAFNQNTYRRRDLLRRNLIACRAFPVRSDLDDGVDDRLPLLSAGHIRDEQGRIPPALPRSVIL